MQPSLIFSVSLFFLPVRVALKIRSLHLHPARLRRFAVFLIQTNVLSLHSGVCFDDMRLDGGGGFVSDRFVLPRSSTLTPAASAVSTTFTTAMVF